MKLLLDTHVFVWALGDPDRLAVRARELIADPANELLVSAVSAFEIATKHRLGKFPQAAALLISYDQAIFALGARNLPISAHHGVVAGQLAWHHRDPFDRILASQSIAEQLPLVTADAAFDSMNGIRVIWD